MEKFKPNPGTQSPNNKNIRNDGTTTPTFKKPAPMPPVKPAKSEAHKK